MPAGRAKAVVVSFRPTIDACVLVAEGVLDSSTYLSLRDRIVKAALDDPRLLILDATGLVSPAQSALSVFTSARWQIGQWSDVPVALVCAHEAGRTAMQRAGITRYVPVYPTAAGAVAALSCFERRFRHRAHVELPAIETSVARSRALVAARLTEWSMIDFIPVTKLVVTVFVENVLTHTDSAPTVRLETDDQNVTVAVSDGSSLLASRHEDGAGCAQRVSGLAIVTAVSRRWGNAPTPSGKTVWAVLGSEDLI